jgi:hypothetical protein
MATMNGRVHRFHLLVQLDRLGVRAALRGVWMDLPEAQCAAIMQDWKGRLPVYGSGTLNATGQAVWCQRVPGPQHSGKDHFV